MTAVSPLGSSFVPNQLGSWPAWSQNPAQYAAATAIAAKQTVSVPTLPLSLSVATTPLYPSIPCSAKPTEELSPQTLQLLNQSKEPSQRLLQSFLPFNLPFAAPIVIQ